MNVVANTIFAPNTQVRCIRGVPGDRLGYGGSHTPGLLDEGAVYTVAVVVESGVIVDAVKGTANASGIILIPHVGCSYPYVWDLDRFVKYEGKTKKNKYGVCVPAK